MTIMLSEEDREDLIQKFGSGSLAARKGKRP